MVGKAKIAQKNYREAFLNSNKNILNIYSFGRSKMLIKARHLFEKKLSRVGMGAMDQKLVLT